MASCLPTALVSVTTSGVIGYPIEDAWRAVKDWRDATCFGIQSALLVSAELDSTLLYCFCISQDPARELGSMSVFSLYCVYSSASCLQDGEKEHTIGALRKSEWGPCGRVVERLTGYDVGNYSQCVA